MTDEYTFDKFRQHCEYMISELNKEVGGMVCTIDPETGIGHALPTVDGADYALLIAKIESVIQSLP